MEYFSRLTERELRSEGILIAEGRLLCERLFHSTLEVLSILAAKGQEDYILQSTQDITPVRREQLLSVLKIESDECIQDITGFPFHRGIIAAANRPHLPALSDWLSSQGYCSEADTIRKNTQNGRNRKIIVIPELVDTGNTGTLLRSAAAFGWDAAVFGATGTDPLSRKALRASMGAALTLPLVLAASGDMRLLRGAGFTCVAAELRPGAISIEETERYADKSIALLIGNEFEGIPDEWRPEGCLSVAIPITQAVDSLNASVAGSIFMYEWSKTHANQ